MQSISSLVKLTEKHKYYHKMHIILKDTKIMQMFIILGGGMSGHVPPPPYWSSVISIIHTSILWRSRVAELGEGQGSASGGQAYLHEARRAEAIYQQRVIGDSRPPEADTFQMILGGFWALQLCSFIIKKVIVPLESLDIKL